jgi:alginate O-acetyltransferase complex protein AlgI
MLFNSYEFLFAFLPGTLIIYFLLLHWRLTIAARSWLLFASLFFYSWWNVKYLPLILCSILFNYTIGGLLADYDSLRRKLLSKRTIFVFGLVANILLLGWFKYLDFFMGTVNGVLGTQFPLLKIVLPLGISFFTITQIAYLVDAYEGLVEERNLLNYGLFVTFFPHLLAGPILHHKEMMPQFDSLRNKVINWNNIYRGLALFAIGLFKKVIIADAFAVWAKAGFEANQPLHFFAAWFASLSFSFQLYFDFSGYSDMAVAIGWMFNIKLPVNFNSPYKATGMIDFWRRWHMSLTDFVTTYLYTPILRAFGKITFARSLVAIFLAMVISGIWHGAGWTFIIWGAMHGLGLVINHVWVKKKLRMPNWLGWIITFNFVNVSFVFFKAKTVGTAIKILQGMAGMNGVMLDGSLQEYPFLTHLGIRFGKWLAVINGKDATWVHIIVAFVLVLTALNSMSIVAKVRPSWRWFPIIVVVAFWAIVDLGKVSEFLYFQF